MRYIYNRKHYTGVPSVATHMAWLDSCTSVTDHAWVQVTTCREMEIYTYPCSTSVYVVSIYVQGLIDALVRLDFCASDIVYMQLLPVMMYIVEPLFNGHQWDQRSCLAIYIEGWPQIRGFISTCTISMQWGPRWVAIKRGSIVLYPRVKLEPRISVQLSKCIQLSKAYIIESRDSLYNRNNMYCFPVIIIVRTYY